MLKMIIADDEYIVREFLKELDIWNESDIQIIAEAIDGQEAYDLCCELKPDILMTDIRMPFMDGLEVSMKLKEQGSNTRFIIISGVQDFDYAKTALSVDAEGYILKPIKLNELKDVVKKVVKGITMEKTRNTELQNIKKLLNENMYLIRENFLRNLVTGFYMKEEEIKAKIDYYNIPVAIHENIMVSVLQVDDYQKSIENYPEEEKLLVNFSISNIINEVMDNYNCGVSFCINDGEHVLIFNKSILYTERHIEICTNILNCIEKFVHLSASIGTGRIVNSIINAQISYKDALSVIKYKFYTGKNSILNLDDIKNFLNTGNKNIEYPNLFEMENNLVNYSKLGNVEKVEQLLNVFFDKQLAIDKNIPVDYIQSICVEMICMLTRSLFELEENIDEIVDKRSSMMEYVYKTDNLKELKDYIKCVFLKIGEYFKRKLSNKNAGSIKKIKEIIARRYMEGIGISALAEEVYLSPNYISLIFKKETGENITDYVKKVRMEAAKELLKNPDLKIQDISEMVGLENPNYFSLVFKKYTGMLPQKYRMITNN